MTYKNTKKLSFLLICTFSFAFFINKIFGLYVSDINYKKSQIIIKSGDFEKALDLSDLAIEKNPMEPRYYYGRAKILLSSTVGRDEKIIADLKNQALKDLERSYQLNPKNLVTIRNIVPLYYFLTVKDLEKPQGLENIDQNFLGTTKSYYEKVKDISPNDVGVYALLAKYEGKLGLDKMYQESILKINILRPDLLEWYINEGEVVN